MNGDTRATHRGQDEPAGYDQEDDVAEYQRQLDATSENPASRKEDSQFEEAAQWADEHPRAAGAAGDPGDESGDDASTSGGRDGLPGKAGSAPPAGLPIVRPRVRG